MSCIKPHPAPTGRRFASTSIAAPTACPHRSDAMRTLSTCARRVARWLSPEKKTNWKVPTIRPPRPATMTRFPR